MKLAFPISAALLVGLSLPPASFAGESAAEKARTKKDSQKAAKTTETARPQPGRAAAARSLPNTPLRLKVSPEASRPAPVRPANSLGPAKPNPQGSRGAGAGASSRPTPVLPLIPATVGTLGFFTMETGDTLPRKGYAFSTYVNKFHREPGSIGVFNLGWTFGVGITDWLTFFTQFEPHRFIHVSRPNRLSFNAPLPNPQFQTTIYRSLLPIPGTAPGYVEDYPFAGHNGGGMGEVTVGFQLGLLAQWRGHPLNVSLRNDFIVPTRTTLSDLLDNQVQSGQFNYAFTVSASRNWHEWVITAFNWGYRHTRNPEFGGVTALEQANQMRASAGFLIFPKRRIQIINEYSGLVFTGTATPNTTFGPRDPVDGVWGTRLYPWRNLAFDLGYRYMLNLRQHGDRHGFVFKVGTVYWPEKPAPVNRSPVSACSAEKSSVYAESGELVGVTAQASDPDGDSLAYTWTATGGRIEGSGASVRWNSSGTSPGTYTVTARVDDGHGATASCAVDIRVEPRPNRAPSLTCSAERSPVLVGERVRVTGTASDPDGDALTYSWRTNGGRIVGSGSAVQLDTSGVAPGTYTVTGRVEDARGAAADCSARVAVQSPPPPPEASKLNECFFRPSSARVDNVCKRILDDVALRLQNDPRARVVLVGYADPKEPRPDKLAEQRAENARKYIVGKGIAAGRVDVRAAGGQAGAGKQNRRLDVIWLPEGATY